jgi:glycosyltransferase involved in cell wall biosynthesis
VALRGSDVPGYNERLRTLDPLIMTFIARRIWSQAARVVAVSRGLRQLALQTRPGTEIDVIPNGVNVQRFKPGPAGDSRRILFVGRLIERKGVTYLLQAFRGVLAAVPDAELVIVGEGPERARLEARAGALGLSGVNFLGHLEGDALSTAYSSSAILALPALADAMPNVVLEAMAAGLAIVTTPTGGSEVLCGNGVVVPAADPEALGAALVGYLTDPIRLAEHQRLSRRLAEGMSWAAVAGYYVQLYHEVVGAAQWRGSEVPGREFRLNAR